MKRKNKTALHRETIRHLTVARLGRVNGASNQFTCGGCITATCTGEACSGPHCGELTPMCVPP